MSDDDLLSLLARWTRALDPDRSLDLHDEQGNDSAWYVDLDAWQYAGKVHNLRGRPATADIVDSIRLASDNFKAQSTHLFAGFRGTGKTTELSRLARELSELGFTVLRMSARTYSPLTDAISIQELAVMLAAGIGEAAQEILGANQLDDVGRQKVWTRVTKAISEVFEKTQVTVKLGPMELRAALWQGDSAEASLRKLIGGRPDLLKTFLHGFVREVAESVRSRQIVVIVDDLEKFDVSPDRVGHVYRQMADLFSNSSDILALPNCHVVYTVPPYLAFVHTALGTKYVHPLHVLPSVKLRGRRPKHEVFEPGVAALRAMLSERIDLERLFGPGNALVDRLINASGGNIRDLFSLARDTVKSALRAGLPVGVRQVDDAIAYHAALRPLLKEPFELLKDVEQKGDLTGVDASRQGGLASALDQHLVLCYWIGEFWYDTHPLIEPQLERHARKAEQT